MDDDDDGTISNTENRAFISEYGGAASSIGALLDDNDGKVIFHGYSPSNYFCWSFLVILDKNCRECLRGCHQDFYDIWNFICSKDQYYRMHDFEIKFKEKNII